MKRFFGRAFAIGFFLAVVAAHSIAAVTYADFTAAAHRALENIAARYPERSGSIYRYLSDPGFSLEEIPTRSRSTTGQSGVHPEDAAILEELKDKLGSLTPREMVALTFAVAQIDETIRVDNDRRQRSSSKPLHEEMVEILQQLLEGTELKRLERIDQAPSGEVVVDYSILEARFQEWKMSGIPRDRAQTEPVSFLQIDPNFEISFLLPSEEREREHAIRGLIGGLSAYDAGSSGKEKRPIESEADIAAAKRALEQIHSMTPGHKQELWIYTAPGERPRHEWSKLHAQRMPNADIRISPFVYNSAEDFVERIRASVPQLREFAEFRDWKLPAGYFQAPQTALRELYARLDGIFAGWGSSLSLHARAAPLAQILFFAENGMESQFDPEFMEWMSALYREVGENTPLSIAGLLAAVKYAPTANPNLLALASFRNLLETAIAYLSEGPAWLTRVYHEFPIESRGKNFKLRFSARVFAWRIANEGVDIALDLSPFGETLVGVGLDFDRKGDYPTQTEVDVVAETIRAGLMTPVPNPAE